MFINTGWKSSIWSAVILHQDWTHIKLLYLVFCKLNDDRIDTLLKLDWPNVYNLGLMDNQLTHIGVKKIMGKQWK